MMKFSTARPVLDLDTLEYIQVKSVWHALENEKLECQKTIITRLKNSIKNSQILVEVAKMNDVVLDRDYYIRKCEKLEIELKELSISWSSMFGLIKKMVFISKV